jgi:hypothetical protein
MSEKLRGGGPLEQTVRRTLRYMQRIQGPCFAEPAKSGRYPAEIEALLVKGFIAKTAHGFVLTDAGRREEVRRLRNAGECACNQHKGEI